MYRTVGELKFFEVAVAGTVIAAGAAIYSPSLNLVDQGNGESQMIGRKITIKKIGMHFVLQLPSSSSGTLGSVNNDDTVRVYLCLDKQANGAAPIANGLGGLWETSSILSWRELENSKRYKVLKSWKRTLTQVVGHNATGNVYMSGPVGTVIEWEGQYPKGIEILMAPNAGTRVIADVRCNNVFLAVLGLRGSMTMQIRSRIRYSDD